LGRFVSTPSNSGRPMPEHEIEVLGTPVRFCFDARRDLLTISAPANEALSLPCTENWLGEPLRILFGQLIFPRLVARRFPQGGAMISLRASPRWARDSDWVALWKGEEAIRDPDAFWTLYGDLLRFIATARNASGHPNFEANTITHHYEEVIQACRGSRWVTALTLAGSIEGLIRLLTPRGTKRPDAHTPGITSIVEHIEKWPAETKEDRHLIGVAISAVHRTAETTPKYVLDELVKARVATGSQVKAWSKIRNDVMHGKLVSPYSSEEDDRVLMQMADLLHALTIHLVRRGNG